MGWCLRSGIEASMLFKMRSCCWSSLTCVRWNSPVIKFFEKLDFLVFVHEFWEQSHMISQVVNHIQESGAISINKYLFANHFLLNSIIDKKPMKMGAWNVTQNIFFSKQMMSTSYIQSDNLTVWFCKMTMLCTSTTSNCCCDNFSCFIDCSGYICTTGSASNTGSSFF